MRAAEYRLSQVSRIVSAVINETSSSGASCLWRFRPLLNAFMRLRITFKAEIWACKDAASSSTDAAASRGGGPIILMRAAPLWGAWGRTARGFDANHSGGAVRVRGAA